MSNAEELLDGRAATYGDRVKNMEAVANMVNGYLDGVEIRSGKRELTGADFAMIMVLYKAYRFAVTPDYSDNVNDIEGYAQIARECVGDKMIDAKSAEEFQAKKAHPLKTMKPDLRPGKFTDGLFNFGRSLVSQQAELAASMVEQQKDEASPAEKHRSYCTPCRVKWELAHLEDYKGADAVNEDLGEWYPGSQQLHHDRGDHE